MSLFREARSVAANLAQQASKRAFDHAPANVKEAVEKIRRRYEEGRVDAQRALEELAQLEERAIKTMLQLLLFPWATAGAIRELYSRMRELEGGIEKRDDLIKRLEDRIRDLERRSPGS